MPKVRKILIPLVTGLFLIITLIAYYPLFNIKNSIKSNGLAIEDYVVNTYNPFKPKITSIIKLSGNEGYWIIVSDYLRTGLFEYTYLGEVNGVKKVSDFGQVDAKITDKTLEEIKQIVSKQDLSKTQYVPEKSDAVKEYEVEQQKPVQCQRIIRPQISYSYDTLKNITKGISFDSPIIGQFSGEVQRSNNTYYLSFGSKDENIIKYNFYFNQILPTYDKNTKIIKATKVYNDCREEEITLPEK